jgi:hypothetical protein
MDDTQIQKLQLASILDWEKDNFDISEKYCILWVRSTLINEKQRFVIFGTKFSI